MMRCALLGLAALVVAYVPADAHSRQSSVDWPVFGYDAARRNVSPDTRITARNVGRLDRLRVTLDGTVDSSAISVGGRLVVTTT
jgi:hypothetical protein